LSVISSLYAAVARRRRERYARRPDLRLRLRRPVVSIGNLAVGGRGKTPLAATVARLLVEAGERPAILSRGYGRTRREDGVVVVRDPRGIRADLARSGDEPLMLARQLPGVSILVSSDRYLAGRLAERHFATTVHILDDGFQHLQLDRDVDIVLVAAADLDGATTLPSGRLREPLDVLVAADAIVAPEGAAVDTQGADIPVFAARRSIPRAPAEAGRVFACAGVAEPPQFFAALRTAGWAVAGTLAFADHHPYSRADAARVFAAARAAGAGAVVTTEKDLVRLLPHRPFPLPVESVPLTMEPAPLPEFRRWLTASLADARDQVDRRPTHDA
jgi:tetraacyldisaccharide 4'-kinase